MRILIISLILLSTLAQADDGSLHYAVHIVFVEPIGETFTQEEMTSAVDNIRGAISFWRDLSPITVTLTIESTAFITTTDDVFNALFFVQNSDMIIYVLDNSSSGSYIYGNSVGWTNTTGIWVVSSADASTYAHEFGHYLFALPHQYTEPLDIMSLVPFVAYQRHMLGCGTLAALGTPCKQIFIPIAR